MSSELLNAQGEFELTGDSRDKHIFDLTRIEPDTRGKIPQEEIRGLVLGTKQGDQEAQERLIATRLRWIYSRAFSEEIRDRADIELRDYLQLGCLATIEAAHEINARSKNVSTLLHVAIPRIMDHFVVDGKLVPAVDDTGRVVYNTKVDRSVIHDRVELVDQAELDEIIERSPEGRDDEDVGPDYAVARGGIDWLFNYTFVSSEQREVLRLRYAYEAPADMDMEERYLPPSRNEIKSGTSLTLREIATMLDTSTQNIHIREANGLDRLREMLDLFPEVSGPGFTAEQIALQNQWMAEITVKQKRGEIAFVKGSLLEAPLPPAMRKYLAKSRRLGPPHRNYSQAFQRALNKSVIERRMQLALQKQWLAGITTKQEYGQLAFVTGKTPLPAPVQKYLEESYKSHPESYDYYVMLQLALAKAGIEYMPAEDEDQE